MEYLIEIGYLGLFLSAFLAATILPLSSEAVLTVLLFKDFNVATLIIVATAGNVLGSLTNYGIGYWLSIDVVKKILRISDNQLLKARERFHTYGLLSLCFAWVPIIGDPLTLIAGVLRIRLAWFIILVTAGKLARYIFIAYFVSSIN